jgi:branched-chain amino acid transport system ATP-binding protein
MLNVLNLHCSPPGDSPLADVSLRVVPGEIVVLTGPNGAGKGTLCRCIARLHHEDHGRIEVDDRPLPHYPHQLAQAGIAVLLRGQRVFPEMSVAENLLAAPWISNRNLRCQRLEEVFSLFPGLKDRSKQVSGTLSGGEQQMVAIGRALLASPRTLVLEEPSMGLSPRLVAEVYRALESLRCEGRAVLVTEEDLRVAAAAAQRAYLLVRGRIISEGTPDKVDAGLRANAVPHVSACSPRAERPGLENLRGRLA